MIIMSSNKKKISCTTTTKPAPLVSSQWCVVKHARLLVPIAWAEEKILRTFHWCRYAVINKSTMRWAWRNSYWFNWNVLDCWLEKKNAPEKLENSKHATGVRKHFAGKRSTGGRKKTLSTKRYQRILQLQALVTPTFPKWLSCIEPWKPARLKKVSYPIANALKDTLHCCKNLVELHACGVILSKGLKVKQNLLRSVLKMMKGTLLLDMRPS